MVESDSEEEITKAEEETVQNSKFKTPEAAAIKLKAKKDLKIIRSQYPHLQINPVSWPSDAEGSAAKKEHKKSEAKTEAKPRSVLTSRKKSSDNTGNQTGSIRSEDLQYGCSYSCSCERWKEERHQETMFPSLQFVMSASFVNLSGQKEAEEGQY